MEGRTGQVSRLDTMIVEVLLELFAWLDLLDILSLRQTCRTHNDASRMPTAWINALRYQEDILGVVDFDRKVSQLPASQIEQYLMKRARCDLNWRSDPPRPTGLRTLGQTNLLLDPRSLFINYMQLLPGGRWLVVASMEGGLSIWDLDFPTGKGHLIIEQAAMEARVGASVLGEVICAVRSDTPKPAFDFLFWTLNPGGVPGTLFLPYRITLLETETNQPKFEATELSSFRTAGSVSQVSLSADRLACQIRQMNLTSRAENRVFDWDKCNATINQTCRIELEQNPIGDMALRRLLLLPHNQLLVMLAHRLFICEIPDMMSFPSLAAQIPVQICPVLWSFECNSNPSFAPAISPLNTAIHYRSTVPLEVTIWGCNGAEYIIRIPGDGSQTDIQVNTFNRTRLEVYLHSGDAIIHGRRRALGWNELCLKLDTLDTRSGGPAIERIVDDIIPYPGWTRSTFNEESGRVCGIRNIGGPDTLLDIVDFA